MFFCGKFMWDFLFMWEKQKADRAIIYIILFYFNIYIYFLNVAHSHRSTSYRYKITWQHLPPMTNFSVGISLFVFLLWEKAKHSNFFLVIGWLRKKQLTSLCTFLVSWTFFTFGSAALCQKSCRVPQSFWEHLAAASLCLCCQTGSSSWEKYYMCEHTRVRSQMIDMCSLLC